MEFNATFLVSAISFLVFVFLMNKIFYAPLTNIINEREKLVDDTLNEAKNSKETALELLKNREDKLNKAHDDSKKIISQSVENANLKSKELTQKAKSDSVSEIARQKAVLQEQNNSIQLDSVINDLAQTISTKILG